MKTIAQLRNNLRFHPEEINSSIKYFKELKIDWNVYLPSKGFNLQRDFVWTLDQKREIIWSILMKRLIPRMAVICNHDMVYQIIDGKQRLSAMIDFVDNKYTLLIDGNEYYFCDLPLDYQQTISNYYFAYYIVHEESLRFPITDEDKIDWFKFINFAGTPQESEHMDKLTAVKKACAYGDHFNADNECPKLMSCFDCDKFR